MATNTITVQLKEVLGSEKDSSRLSTLSAAASIDAEQDAGLGAITLTLEYVNEGSEEIELIDPIDQIQYTLVSSDGYPIKMPPYVPRLLADSEYNADDRLGDKFTVLSIQENGKYLDVREQLKQKRITLKPRIRYSITLRILKIMKKDKPVPIPSGDYAIVLTCMLITSSKRESERRLLESEQIKFTLK